MRFIAVNPLLCTGCRECEMVCSLNRFGESHPERSAVRVVRNESQGLAEPLPLVCQVCSQPACIESCPVEAITTEPTTGLLIIDDEICTGCGECTSACPAGCIFLDAVTDRAVACDLCGGDPQCVPLCHSQCLTLGESTEESGEVRVNRMAETLRTLLTAGAGAGGGR